MQGRWNDVVRRVLRDGHPALAAALGETRPTGVDGAAVSAVAPPARLPALEARQAQHALMAAFQAVLGLPLQLLVRPGEAAAPGEDRSRRWRESMDHPVVRELVKRLEAEPLSRELIGRDEWLERFAGESRAAGGGP